MISHEANKGYGNSLTAPVDIVTQEYAKHLLLSLSETVGARLRADNVMISVVSVHLTTCEFKRMNKQMQLDSPTNITEEIYGAACQILDKLWDKKHPSGRLVSTHQKCRRTLQDSTIFLIWIRAIGWRSWIGR